MSLIGDDYTTGDGLTLGVSLVLLEIPDEAWIKQVLISAFNTLTIEENWSDEYGDITTDQATRIMSLMLQTLQFNYEPPMTIPAGATMIWHTNAPPTRWLLCDGGAVLKAEYPELYAVIGDEYGSTETQFGLPDMSDVSPMGVGGFVGLNDFAGSDTVTLTTNQIPAHNHGVTDPGHTHPPLSPSTTFLGNKPSGTNTAPASTFLGTSATTGSATTGISTNNTGDGDAHNNLSPVFGVYFIIYGGA